MRKKKTIHNLPPFESLPTSSNARNQAINQWQQFYCRTVTNETENESYANVWIKERDDEFRRLNERQKQIKTFFPSDS